MKKGTLTTEFWTTVVTAIAGVVLAFMDKGDAGVAAALVAFVVVAYVINRAIVKAAYLKPVEPTEKV